MFCNTEGSLLFRAGGAEPLKASVKISLGGDIFANSARYEAYETTNNAWSVIAQSVNGVSYAFAVRSSSSASLKWGVKPDGSLQSVSGANFAGTVTQDNAILSGHGDLDVGDKLKKADDALTAIKAAVSDTSTDLAGLKAAILAALSNH